VATRWWKNFDDMFIRFDTTHERDRQTHTHTHTHTHRERQTDTQTLHDDIGRAYASHRAAKIDAIGSCNVCMNGTYWVACDHRKSLMTLSDRWGSLLRQQMRDWINGLGKPSYIPKQLEINMSIKQQNYSTILPNFHKMQVP